MSHANTCTSDINAWVKLLGGDYDRLFNESLKGDADCGGVVTVPYLSGEPIVHMDEGRPLVIRDPDARFTLANFMRANIYSAFTTMCIGLELLFAEGLKLKSVTGHGGIFKTPKVAQQYLADALAAPVGCLATAGEGGAWGMAVLAAYALAQNSAGTKKTALETYLAKTVFKGAKGLTLKPSKAGVKGFAEYLARFKAALPSVAAAVKQQTIPYKEK
jgi:sugar (pentulose or hexulose) kinase